MRLNQPLSFSSAVVVLGLAGFFTWNNYRHRRRPETAPHVAAAVSTKTPRDTPPGPVFPGFDPAATQRALQGVWLDVEEADEDEIIEIRGANWTEYQGDQTRHATMTVSSPCSVSMKLDGDGISRSFATTAAGARFDFADGRRLGKRTVLCVGAKLFIDDGEHCAGWVQVEDGTWDPVDGSCVLDKDQLVMPGNELAMFKEQDGALFPDEISTQSSQRFATVDDAKRALAASQTKRRASIARMHDLLQMVIAANADPWLALGVHVQITAVVAGVDRGSRVLALADNDKNGADAASVHCVLRAGSTLPRRGARETIQGTISKVSPSVALGGTDRVDLADCLIQPK